VFVSLTRKSSKRLSTVILKFSVEIWFLRGKLLDGCDGCMRSLAACAKSSSFTDLHMGVDRLMEVEADIGFKFQFIHVLRVIRIAIACKLPQRETE
jgi:hypothetical protein